MSKISFWFLGILAGLSLFVEEKRRRGELAMYVLPKGLESAWVMARGKGLVFKTGQWGEILVSLITGIVFRLCSPLLVDRRWDGNGHGTFSSHIVFFGQC